MKELPPEVKAALDDLMSAAEHYGRWCSPPNLHALRDARSKADKVIATAFSEEKISNG